MILEWDVDLEDPDLLPDSWSKWFSIFGSLLIHLSIIGVAAAFLRAGTLTPRFDGVQIHAVDTVLADLPGPGDSIELAGGFEGGPAFEAASPDPATFPLDATVSDDSELSLKVDDSFPALLAANHLPEGALTQRSGTPSGRSSGKGAGNGFGTGSGSGTGTGDGTGSGSGSGRFFGLNKKYKSIVFVVDASGSMNMPHPGPLRTRFNRVKYELLQTISAMTEKDRFFIIFFGEIPYPMPANFLIKADDDGKHNYLKWMAQAEAIGKRTIPQGALQLALRLEPDAIYFLTDGAFDPKVVDITAKANKKGIPIHTIGFNDRQGETLLKDIAEQNQGTYTYIPPDEANLKSPN